MKLKIYEYRQVDFLTELHLNILKSISLRNFIEPDELKFKEKEIGKNVSIFRFAHKFAECHVNDYEPF